MNNNIDFIVSLTSYYKRIDTLHMCLETLFSQTVLANKIILYVDDSVNLNKMPKEIIKYLDLGLEIVQVSSELKSHNKYFYSLKRFQDTVVITVDDDVLYENDLFRNLLESYKKYPNAISAGRVHNMKFDNKGNLKPYLDWEFEYSKTFIPSHSLFATGVGGVLYPPKIMPNETFNKTSIKSLSLYADDIWLKFMQTIKGIPTVWCQQIKQHPTQIVGTKSSALFNQNRYNNDIYIKKIIKYYNINIKKLID